MRKEKRRPTLEELNRLPPDLWKLECAQMEMDEIEKGNEKGALEAYALFSDPEISPEKIVELREKLRSASGSTEQAA
jgi:hypothetical protein